ncbi:MAG: hypothetical protein PVG53_12025, partial [Holophagae bacterium]
IFAAIVVVFGLVVPASAQTTHPGDAVHVQIYNPVDGSNAFCVAPGATFQARLFIEPGQDATTCTLSCSPPSVPGGQANLATGVVDVAFDTTRLSYVADSIVNNPATAAAQGMPQEQNVADGRIGWALAGTWSTPGNPGSTLMSPCDMAFLTTDSWLFAAQFQAVGSGMTTLHIRRETDTPPFALSFADICGSEAFKQSNGGIGSVTDGVVLIDIDCANVLFFDSFEDGAVDRWSNASAD